MASQGAPRLDETRPAAEPIGRRNRGPTKHRSSPVRQAQKELTKRLLVDAARSAFEERPYVDVTVDDIARAAGASRATFYLYFDSKGAILREIGRQLRSGPEYRELFARFVAMKRPTVQLLQQWLDAYVDFYRDHLGFHRAFHQAQAIEPEFAQFRLAEIDAYIKLWRSLGFVRTTDSADLRVAAMMMFALAEETLYLWLVDGFDADRDGVTRGLAESFHATLRRG